MLGRPDDEWAKRRARSAPDQAGTEETNLGSAEKRKLLVARVTRSWYQAGRSVQVVTNGLATVNRVQWQIRSRNWPDATKKRNARCRSGEPEPISSCGRRLA
jgi:hypothetical protein